MNNFLVKIFLSKHADKQYQLRLKANALMYFYSGFAFLPPACFDRY